MPKIGNLVKGTEIGFKNRQNYIWANCPRCHTPRWMPYKKQKREVLARLCFKCVGSVNWGVTRYKVMALLEKGVDLNKLTLQEIGTLAGGVTRERARQILKSLGVKKSYCYRGSPIRSEKAKQVRRTVFDDASRKLGYHNFRDLVNRLGLNQKKQGKEIAELLSVPYTLSTVYKALHEEGYSPPRYLPYNPGWSRGKKQSLEHLKHRMEANRRAINLKKFLGIPFRTRMSSLNLKLDTSCKGNLETYLEGMEK